MVSLEGMLKLRITVAVVLTCLVGYVLAKGAINQEVLLPTLGLALMSFAAACLNHFQECQLDEKMERTSSRPIPAGLLTPRQVLLISFSLFLLASSILLATHVQAFWLCVMAMFWYNAIYTPLKKWSAYSVLPGAVIGCLPPLVGWHIGGGELLDFQILSVCLFIFFWQVPHFWLLALRFRGDYKSAGYPQVMEKLSDEQVSRVIFFWIFATVGSAMLIPLYRGFHFNGTILALALAGIVVLLLEKPLLEFGKKDVNLKRSFMVLNMYALSTVLMVSLDKILSFS